MEDRDYRAAARMALEETRIFWPAMHKPPKGVIHLSPRTRSLEPADTLIRTRSPRRAALAPPVTPERKCNVVPMEVIEKSPGSDTGTSHGDSSGAHSFIHVEISTDGQAPLEKGGRDLDDTKHYPRHMEFRTDGVANLGAFPEAENWSFVNPAPAGPGNWQAPPDALMRAELERAHAQAAEHAGLCHELKNRLECYESSAHAELTRIQQMKEADANVCMVMQHECESEVNAAKREMQEAHLQLKDIQSQLLQARLTAEEAVRGTSYANKRSACSDHEIAQAEGMVAHLEHSEERMLQQLADARADERKCAADKKNIMQLAQDKFQHAEHYIEEQHLAISKYRAEAGQASDCQQVLLEECAQLQATLNVQKVSNESERRQCQEEAHDINARLIDAKREKAMLKERLRESEERLEAASELGRSLSNERNQILSEMRHKASTEDEAHLKETQSLREKLARVELASAENARNFS